MTVDKDQLQRPPPQPPTPTGCSGPWDSGLLYVLQRREWLRWLKGPGPFLSRGLGYGPRTSAPRLIPTGLADPPAHTAPTLLVAWPLPSLTGPPYKLALHVRQVVHTGQQAITGRGWLSPQACGG